MLKRTLFVLVSLLAFLAQFSSAWACNIVSYQPEVPPSLRE